MRLNIKTTKYVECGEQTPGTIFVDDAKLPEVSTFEYLGSRISADGSTLVEAEYRTNAAWSKWRQVTGVMFDRKVPLKLKSKVYRIVHDLWHCMGRNVGRPPRSTNRSSMQWKCECSAGPRDLCTSTEFEAMMCTRCSE
ncbi:hypothetical protein Y032_0012g1779 [Ancylostoma ceylanicum]|uniref:Uncharacterized protein n=1 Tax=Ancylostoma ceylanicum TaxID=53326 RepID=A0A016VES1_9BILA|nr:hypothetical protein Y032_0012g1779 [Ancylostoma ceylanicum]